MENGVEMVRCSNCGNMIEKDSALSIDENEQYYFCDEDCANAFGFCKCLDCGKWTSSTYYIEEYGNVCLDCYNNGDYHCCCDCGSYYHVDDMRYDSHNNNYVCDNCYNDHWTTCCGCDSFINMDVESYYTDDDGYDYCEDCHDHGYGDSNHDNGNINDYGFKPTPVFKPNYDADNLYMGVELEVDDGDDGYDFARWVSSNYGENVYCKHDGSLSDEGVEIVSHPCVLDYHINQLGWQAISEEATNRDFRSHDTNTCGLHIHVNRTFFGDGELMLQDLNIAKLVLLVNRFWESHIIPFSRRNIDELTHWANKNKFNVYKEDTDLEIRDKVCKVSDEGRYQAINLQNDDTVEFRIFRGTLKMSTFIATLQFVDTICRFAKKIKLNDIDKTTWEDIFEGTNYTELNEYLTERTDFDISKVVNVVSNRPKERVFRVKSWEDMAKNNYYDVKEEKIYLPYSTFERKNIDLCGKEFIINGKFDLDSADYYSVITIINDIKLYKDMVEFVRNIY